MLTAHRSSSPSAGWAGGQHDDPSGTFGNGRQGLLSCAQSQQSGGCWAPSPLGTETRGHPRQPPARLPTASCTILVSLHGPRLTDCHFCLVEISLTKLHRTIQLSKFQALLSGRPLKCSGPLVPDSCAQPARDPRRLEPPSLGECWGPVPAGASASPCVPRGVTGGQGRHRPISF